MDILVKISDNTVVKTGDLRFVDSVLYNGDSVVLGVSEASYYIVNDVVLPTIYYNNCYTYENGIFTPNDNYTQAYIAELARKAEEEIAEKNRLLSELDNLQFNTLYQNADKWMSKSEGAKLTCPPDQADILAKATQVALWANEIRAQDDVVSIDNTLTEIQAKIDDTKDLIELFPYLNQTDYDNDTLEFRPPVEP